MRIPRAITKLIESFEKLPGIGPKTAQRLTFYLLHFPQENLDNFASALSNLKKGTEFCSTCKNIGEENPCYICQDVNRDKHTIMVVEQPLDLLAFERTGKYTGVYHVLHGAINPLENIGPDEIFIGRLLDRILNRDGEVEIILATNPTMEGEATAMYIRRQIEELQNGKGKIIITRLGLGLPTGADVEYADETTLTRAIEGRKVF